MICLNCKKEFNEPKIIETTYEAYLGAPVETHTYLRLEVCPYCNSEDIQMNFEELEEEEEEELWIDW